MEHGGPVLGFQLDCVDGFLLPSRTSNRRPAARPKVGDPPCLAIRALDIRASIKLDETDGNSAALTRPSTPHRQKHIGRSSGHAGGDHLAGDWVDQAEEPGASSIPQIKPRRRAKWTHVSTINTHSLNPHLSAG